MGENTIVIELCSNIQLFFNVIPSLSGHLWNAEPVISLLHGFTRVVHWFCLIPLVPVRT